MLLAASVMGSTLGCATSAPTGPHVSAAEQRRLPTDEYLFGAMWCPRKHFHNFSANVQRQSVRRLRALIVALHVHPDYVVTARYAPADSTVAVAKEELSINALAETFLSASADTLVADDSCAFDFRRRVGALTN